MIGRGEVVQGRRRLALGAPDAELRARLTRDLDCDDLVALVQIFASEMARLDRPRTLIDPLVRATSRVPLDTRAASPCNIAAHYYLGYRELRGSYSKLVSIKTIEAVGWQ
jgi:hypothetical protein